MKNEYKFLLACGGGMSSGFVAQEIRKAAKKQGIKMNVRAVSEGDIVGNLQGVDALLLGPHLSASADREDIRKVANQTGMVVMVIDSKDYSTMDGKSVLEKTLKKIEEK